MTAIVCVGEKENALSILFVLISSRMCARPPPSSMLPTKQSVECAYWLVRVSARWSNCFFCVRYFFPSSLLRCVRVCARAVRVIYDMYSSLPHRDLCAFTGRLEVRPQNAGTRATFDVHRCARARNVVYLRIFIEFHTGAVPYDVCEAQRRRRRVIDDGDSAQSS